MNVRLKSLRLSGFRSFVVESTTPFPERGLVLIAGTNQSTRGSSGSGKSSLNLAVAYALGFCPFPATELQSWNSSDPMVVELTLETAAGELVVRRGPGRLAVALAGEPFKGGAKQVEQQLYAALGLNSEMLALLTYRGQKRPGLFLSKTDAEKKEFLTQVLGLDVFEAAIEEAQDRVKALSLSLAEGQQRIETYRAERDRRQLATPLFKIEQANQEQKGTCQKWESEVRDCGPRLDEHKKAAALRADCAEGVFEVDLASAQRRLAQLRQAFLVTTTDTASASAELLLDCRHRIASAKADDTNRRSLGKRELDRIQAEIDSCMQSSARIPLLQRQIENHEIQRAKLTAEVCPTCDRHWDRTADAITQLDRSVEQLRSSMLSCHETVARLPSLHRDAAPLRNFYPDPVIEKLQTTEAELQARIAAEQAAAREARLREIVEAEGLVNDTRAKAKQARLDSISADARTTEALQTKLDEAKAGLRSAENRMYELAHELRMAQSQKADFDRYVRLLAEQSQSEQELTTELNAEQDFLELVGNKGFLGAIFAEVLEEISQETNDTLGAVANTSDCTLTFKTETTTQKGTTTRKILPVISVRGTEASLASGTSGGMATVIELAVDLAVGAVISRRTGVSPGWLILDECFEGLGTVEKGSCMEILQRYATERLILVVDHATEFKSLFTRTINIECTNGCSRINSIDLS